MPLTYMLKTALRRPEPLERLSSLDAQFLHLEDDASPMHIAAMCTFEGPVPSREDIIRLMSSRLSRIPRYRQVIRVPPLELGRPVWVDDQKFKLAYHIRRIALASPYDDASLNAMMGRLISMRLDRSRPLWELYIVEGLKDGRWALISKTHHAMVDGIAGTNLIAILLDDTPDAELEEPQPWTPQPEPSRLTLLQDAWRGFYEDSWVAQRTLWAQLRRPEVALRAWRDLATGLTNYWRTVLTPTRSSMSGTIGKHRAYAHTVVSLSDVQRIRKTLGGTVNDVVMTAVAGGYRAILQSRGCDPDKEVMRTLMPVSVRTPDAHGAVNNQVSFLLCDLSINLKDPVERLGMIHVETKRLKKSRMAEAGAFLNALGNLTAPWISGPVTRGIGKLMHKYPQRSFGTVTTNVPGPPRALYLMGRKMLDWFPYVPISQGQRLGTAILSYAGKLGFGFTADYDTVPDVDVMAQGVKETFDELLTRVRHHTEHPPKLETPEVRTLRRDKVEDNDNALPEQEALAGEKTDAGSPASLVGAAAALSPNPTPATPPTGGPSAPNGARALRNT